MKRLILIGMIHAVTNDCSLFERTTAALALHESALLCGNEPAWNDHAAWYAFGDCSGYFGPIDSVERGQ